MVIAQKSFDRLLIRSVRLGNLMKKQKKRNFEIECSLIFQSGYGTRPTTSINQYL